MIHFEWPWMALLLPLPWLCYRFRSPASQGGIAVFLPFTAALQSAAVAESSRWRKIGFMAIWLCLLLASMRPQWLGDPLPVPTTGRRLLLAVDVSGSMASKDMEGDLSRLQVVQAVAGNFIDRRQGDRVGLILFGTAPYLQAPMTTDLTTVHAFLDEAVIGIAGRQTALGDAIGLAIKRLRAETKQKSASAETVLILLTDGRNTAGAMPPLQAAKLAAKEGLRIYTIGVGALPQQGVFGLLQSGSDLDEKTLQEIASVTGGEHFRAMDAEALQKVYARIDVLEPAAGRDQWLRPADEWFSWPLALALLISLPAVLRGSRAWA